MVHSDSSHSTPHPAPPPPSGERSLLALPLACLARLAVRAPVAVIALSLAVAIAGGFLALGGLRLKTSRLDLINPNSGFNRLWLDYLQEFGDDDEVIVVVSGPNNATVIPALDVITERVSASPETFGSVLSGIDLSRIRAKALHYLGEPELATISGFASEASRLAGANWDSLSIVSLLGTASMRMQIKEQADAGQCDLERLTNSLASYLATQSPTYVSPWGDLSREVWSDRPDVVAMCSQTETPHFLFPTPHGVIGLIMLRITTTADAKSQSFTYAGEPISQLRHLVETTRRQFPETEMGITGMVVIENDEMRQSSVSMGKVTLISFFGVAAIFIAGFGGFRHSILAVLALLVGFGWTMVYLTLGIGHLNILSMAFGVILIGLGIDFGIHYVARYLQTRQHERSPTEALVQSARSVGPGVVTGALTSAAAFFLVGQSEFTGIAELGLISAGGVVLCCLAAIFLLPAMIQLADASRPKRPYGRPLNVARAVTPLLNFPRCVLLVAVAVTVFLACQIPNVRYDHNLLNLHAEGEESVTWERRLLALESGVKNTWYALSIAESREELLRRKSLFAERYPELTIEEIVSFFPEADPAKTAAIASVAATLATLPEHAAPSTPPDAVACVQMLRQLQNQNSQNPSLRHTQETLRNVERSLLAVSQQVATQRLAHYQTLLTTDLLSRLRTLRGMASPQPPTLDDLPHPLVTRFVSAGGKHLMRIYTKADIWNMDEMETFVQKVRDIDPKATGSPLQTYEASRQMQQGYTTAAVYAMIAVCLILLLDLRSPRDVLLALTPMTLGTLQAAGILGWLDIPLNPANMIALPLILGIGIDDGVHVVHDARLQRGKYRLSPSTATSILMTSLTTMIGFGSLMLASHQGLQSLGRVLVIGVSCAMVTSLIVLPALLRWITTADLEPNTPNQLAQPRPNTATTGTATTETAATHQNTLAAILTNDEIPHHETPASLPLPTSSSRLRRRAA